MTKIKNLKKIIFTPILFFSFFALGQSAEAADLYVDKDGRHNNNVSNCSDNYSRTEVANSNWIKNFCSIQKAADVVEAGDTVIVANGIYSGSGYMVLIQRGGNALNWVTFKAENKRHAVLDGQSGNKEFGFYVYGPGGHHIIIDGFEIKDTKYGAMSTDGLASYIIFKNNYAHGLGNTICDAEGDSTSGVSAGGFSTGSHHIMYDSNIIHDIGRMCYGEGGCAPATSNCMATDHGIYGYGRDIIMINNIFYNNDNGHDIQVAGPYGLTQNWIIANNVLASQNPWYVQRPYSGNLLLWHPCAGEGTLRDIFIYNNIFYDPLANAGINYYDLCTGSSIANQMSNIQVKNNLHHNCELQQSYAGYEGNFIIDGNKSGDPLITDYPGKDFHINSNLSPVVDSGIAVDGIEMMCTASNVPFAWCTGAGTGTFVAYDYEGNIRSAQIDIGAYEYVSSGGDTTAPASPSGLAVQ